MNTTTLEPSPGAPAEYPHEESRVRHKLGLTKDDLRTWRKKNLVEGQDFITHKKRLYWRLDAVERALKACGVAPKKTAPAAQRAITDDGDPVKKVPAQKTATPAPPAKPVQLKVVRADLQNRHMLLACPIAEDHDRPKTLLRVRVRSTANFKRGMVLPALPVTAFPMPDLYDLARACPRKKGQW